MTPRPRSVIVFAAAIAAVTVAACARQVRNVQVTPTAPAVVSELWQAPQPRDLFPAGAQIFTFVRRHAGGRAGFDVRDDAAWSGASRPARSPIRSCDLAHLGQSDFISRRTTTSRVGR